MPSAHNTYWGLGGRKEVARPRSGTVVIVVMVVVVLLTYACYQFVDRMAVENIAATTHAEFSQLATCVDSGESFVQTLLTYPPVDRKKLGGFYDQQKLFCGRIIYDSSSPNGRGRFTVIGPRFEGDQVAGLQFGLINESSKLSLGGLLAWERQQPGAARHALMQLPGMKVSQADALLDWVDSDSVTREEGAEAAEYGSLGIGTPSTLPANQLVRTLDGLLPVQGITRRLLFGADRNANFHLSAREQEVGDPNLEREGEEAAWETDLQPWSYYLTPYSAERNQTQAGRARVFLNDPDLQRLHGELTQRFPDNWVNFILLYRQFGPASDLDGNAMPATMTIDMGLPAIFQIESIYQLIGAKVHVPSQADDPLSPSQVWNSPFSSQSAARKDYLLELADQVTVNPQPILTGRVNLNVALPLVLRGVPGMSDELVKKIIAHRMESERENGAGELAGMGHEAWILVEDLVSVAQMHALAPYVTTRGDLFRAQIIGYYDQGTLALREEVLLDATFTPPRTIYRRDLRHLGRGYSLDVLLGGRLSSVEEGADSEVGTLEQLGL